MRSYSIQSIKTFLREQGYNEVEKAQLLNLLEGYGELKYQEGIRDANKPGAADQSRDALRVLRGGKSENQKQQAR